jgi:hypothetical protein
LFADLNGGLAFHAGTEENGDQLAVLEGIGAALDQALAGAFLVGHVFDAQDGIHWIGLL